MKENIAIKLSEIYSALQDRNANTLSLLQGEAGYCLFAKMYHEYAGLSGAKEFQNSLQALAENSIGHHYPTFADGKPGINWFFSYLKYQDILTASDWELLCDDDEKWAQAALEYLKGGHYDFLHGAIGIAHHLLYSRADDKAFKPFFSDFFDVLAKVGVYHEGCFYYPDFDRSKREVVQNRINFGLAHGIPSIIKFCVECYQRGICTAEAKRLALDLIGTLKRFVNKDTSLYSFPNLVNVGLDYSTHSRLAWCYGDLGIGFVLYQSAKAFEDFGLEEFALGVLKNTTKNRNITETVVYDADFCHGAAGISYMYNKLWHYSKDDAFQEASEFWLRETLNMAIYDDGLAGYKSYTPTDRSYTNSFGLLDGICGIGLVLLSYLSGNFSWDYCLMLND